MIYIHYIIKKKKIAYVSIIKKKWRIFFVSIPWLTFACIYTHFYCNSFLYGEGYIIITFRFWFTKYMKIHQTTVMVTGNVAVVCVIERAFAIRWKRTFWITCWYQFQSFLASLTAAPLSCIAPVLLSSNWERCASKNLVHRFVLQFDLYIFLLKLLPSFFCLILTFQMTNQIGINGDL